MLKTAIAALSVVLAVPAIAATGGPNLVANSSFETGNFSNWMRSGDQSFSFVSDQFASGGPIDGQFHAVLGSVDAIGALTQILTTTPGTQYNISFGLANLNGSTPNSFQMFWGNTIVFGLNNTNFFDYQTYSFTRTATAPTTELIFRYSNPQGFWLLDKINVNDPTVVVVTPIPEPASWAMMVLGFGLAGASLRRRQAAVRGAGA
jgi:PEP-CTERM motif